MAINKRIRMWRFILLYALIGILCISIVFPFYWMVRSSLQPEEMFGAILSLFPSSLSLKSYINAFTLRPLSNWLINSVIVSVGSASLSICFSIFFFFFLSRFDFRGRLAFIALLIIPQMISGVLLVIPLYAMWRDLHLLNTLQGLIIVYMCFNVPLCAVLLKGFFDSIPPAIEEAGLIDGCSRMGAFLRITLPLSSAGIGVVFLFAFLQSWNEFVYAATFLSQQSKFTVNVGLYSFITERALEWSGMMAATTVAVVPAFILFLFIQKYLIKGMGGGGVKG